MILDMFKRKDKQFIFNFAAVLGVGLTMASTIKDTTKACKLIDDDMTLQEKIKTTWKCYIPSSLIATSTVMCIIYSDYVAINEKISMLNALMTVQNNYKTLKSNVNNTCDDETKEEIMKKNIRDRVSKGAYIERTGEKTFYEEYRGEYFTSTIDNILKAEYLFNKQLSIVGYATLNDFYKYIGISETDAGKCLGWSTYDICDDTSPSYPWVDFTHNKMEDDSGLECFYLGYSNEPETVRYYFNSREKYKHYYEK